jgi:hypothetical protein
VFFVSPAIYPSSGNQPWIGVQDDARVPVNVSIVGITDCSSGTCYRPLFQYSSPDGNLLGIGGGSPAWFLDGATNLVIQNIDLTLITGASGWYSFVASCGNGGGAGPEALTDTLLRRMRIFNGEISNADGVSGCLFVRNNGYLWLDQMEMHNNGGQLSSYQHNLYVNPSIDPTYTLKMTNSWIYNTCYGYDFKSRARYLDLEGNYFQGGLAQSTCTPYLMAENANTQAANGGSMTIKDNIYTRNDGSNLNGCYLGASGPEAIGRHGVMRHWLLSFIIRIRPRRLAMPAMMAMVHEEMHQRTRQYEQPRQRPQNMRGVLHQ